MASPCARAAASSLLLLLCLALTRPAASHAVLACPNQRGTLRGGRYVDKVIDPKAPNDHSRHFPAGRKKTSGVAKASQVAEAGSIGWNEFEPLRKDFHWRAGVCGDLKSRNDHLRGGIYYHGGEIVATYDQGQVISIDVTFVSNHNGFFEFHMCDVEKCGGEISEKCFRDGHCYQLQRAENPDCDGGMSTKCGPIDPKRPGRWYVPCTPNFQGTVGKGSMLYQLPKHLSGDHFVLQWYWAAANQCNPPGFVEYFDSPSGPKNWGKCKGQASARGGFYRFRKRCSKVHFPEEYLQCADVAIRKTSGSSSGGADDRSEGGGSSAGDEEPSPTPTMTASVSPAPTMTALVSPTVTPTPEASPTPESSDPDEPSPSPAPSASPTTPAAQPRLEPDRPCVKAGVGAIRGLFLIGDGVRIRKLCKVDRISVSDYTTIGFEPILHSPLKIVRIYEERKLRWSKARVPVTGGGATPYVYFEYKPRKLYSTVKLAVVGGRDRDPFYLRFGK